MTRIAIIGAGISGLVVARALSDAAEVTVFEKARGVGGRMATRRHDHQSGIMQFDHGAQFFTAHSPAFRHFLQPFIKDGTVRCWNADFAELRRAQVSRSWQWSDAKPHYVGAPGMNALGKALARGLDVRLQTAVAALERQNANWQLRDGEGQELGAFDWVILTAPAPQTASLLPASCLLASTEVIMQPCYALMLGFEQPSPMSWQAARVLDADISWISVDSSKSGRPDSHCIVAHSTNAWAAANIEIAQAQALAHLLGEVSDVLDMDVSGAIHTDLHRWRFANLERRTAEPAMVDAENKLALCGDWLVHGRVEAAFESARRMLDQLVPELA